MLVPGGGGNPSPATTNTAPSPRPFFLSNRPMESNATARRPAQIEQFEALQVIVAAFLQAYNTPLPPDRRALWAMQTLEGMACRRGPVQLLLR